MTDPERISKRSLGLAAQLLQAGAEEQPTEAAVQRTLAAVGVSAAIVTTSSAASAIAGGAKAGSALSAGAGAGAGAGSAGLGGAAAVGAVKAVTATLLAKWIGIGVVGGVALAGAAAVATGPSKSSSAVPAAASQIAKKSPRVPAAQAAAPESPASAAPDSSPSDLADVPGDSVARPAPAVASAPHVSASEPVAPELQLEVGAPLAAEVAYVDRARALVVAGRAEQGLALLRGYEREFAGARLLPEVLFLELETCNRLGRASEARAAAQRLLDGFPKSPHASRARKLLFP